MNLYTEQEVKRDDVERYREALRELGGEASLEDIADHADGDVAELFDGWEPDLGYVVACLVVRVPTERDPRVVMPFAFPSAWGRDREGRRTWRTERYWTPDDFDEAQRFFRARARQFEQQADNLIIAKETAAVLVPGEFRFYCVTTDPPGEVAPTDGAQVDGCHGGPLGYRARPVGTSGALMVELAERVTRGALLTTDGEGRARLAGSGDVVIARARESGGVGETIGATFVMQTSES